jgi:hypothetical protein
MQAAAYWMIFKKAGKPGWHSVIPVLNVYDQFDISWKGSYGIIMLAALGVASALSPNTDDGTMPVIGIICGILGMVIAIVGNYKLAKCFGKGFITFLGLIFLEPLFMLILGFGSARYVGKR